MTDIEAALAGATPAVRVENFTWSPVHVVQRFQTGEMQRPGRVVLVGQAAVSSAPGTVKAFRWRGGQRDNQEMQERIYEAVTGIVDLENTLIIGAHFGVWPEECFTVEADLPADTFGRMVIAENEKVADEKELAGTLGFSSAETRAETVRVAAALAKDGCAADIALADKTAGVLAPVQPFTETHIAVAAGKS